MAADGSGLQLLEERLSKGVGATDWAALIALIIPLIASCLNPPKPETLRNPPRGTRASFAQAIRRDARARGERPPGFDEALDTYDAVLALAREATDEELQALVDDCCS